MIIKEVLEIGYNILKENNIQNASLSARRLLAKILNKDKEYLITHDTENISEELKDTFLKYIERLKSHEPIQYILNHQEFMGLDFFVNENVLIPQPDTEILVQEAIKICNNIKKAEILDLCTGSGIVAISISKLLKNTANICASDISRKALEVASINAYNNKVNINLIESNLFENINGKFDIIVSNPPYIETKTLESLSEEVKKEPKIALDGGEDGLLFYKKIINDAKKYLKKDGYIAFEIGYNQKESVVKLLEENNYKNIYSKTDLSGNDRIVIARN